MASNRSSPGLRLVSCLFLLIATAAPHANPAPPSKPDGALEVRGDGFSFVVREPPGWFVDSAMAKERDADALFYPATASPHESKTPLIRIVAVRRPGDGAETAMNRDLEQYRSRQRYVKIAPASVAHPHYRTVARRVCGDRGSCDYVAQVESARNGGLVLSVVLSSPSGPAPAADLAAYRRIVASLHRLAAE